MQELCRGVDLSGFAGCARQTQDPVLQGAAAAAAGCPMLLVTCSSAVLQAGVGEAPQEGFDGSRPARALHPCSHLHLPSCPFSIPLTDEMSQIKL